MSRRRRKALLVTMLLAVVLAAFIVAGPTPVLGASLSVLGLTAAAALWYPYEVAALALAAGALLPSYFDLKYFGLPVQFNGPLAVAVILAVAAGTVLITERRSEWRGFGWMIPAGFVLLWVGGPLVGGGGAMSARISYVLSTSTSGALAVTAAWVLVARERGRRLVTVGIIAGGALAATYGVIEYLLGFNPALVAGSQLVPSVAGYLAVPARLGMQRLSATFSHPIMFALFLGLSIICLLGLYRVWRVPPVGVTVALATAILVVDLGTLSRAAVLACVLVCGYWSVLSLRETRTRLLVAAALTLALIGGGVLVASNPVTRDLVSPGSETEAGTSITYRVQLARSLVGAFGQAPLVAGVNPDQEEFLGEFASLDNQGANLLRSRGYVGLLAYALLALAPLVMLRRVTEQSRFAVAIIVFLVSVGATVAIFGSVELYVLVAFVLALGLARSGSVREGAAGA